MPPDLWGGQRKHMETINCRIAVHLKATHAHFFARLLKSLRLMVLLFIRIVFPNLKSLFPDKAKRHLSAFRVTQPGVKVDYGLIPDSCF